MFSHDFRAVESHGQLVGGTSRISGDAPGDEIRNQGYALQLIHPDFQG